MPEEYGGTFLPCVISRFSKMHPNVEVTVQCASSSEVRLEFDKGELDLVLIHEDAAMIGGENGLLALLTNGKKLSRSIQEQQYIWPPSSRVIGRCCGNACTKPDTCWL